MRLLRLASALPLLPLAISCAAAGHNEFTGGASSTGTTGTTAGAGGGSAVCNTCFGDTYTPCEGGKPGTPIKCTSGACAPGLGCVTCVPGSTSCDGNQVRKCGDDGASLGPVVQTCDAAKSEICGNGKCGTACALAAEQPSNVGCEFWAVDLDQQDGLNDPASEPWGVVVSNASDVTANVVVEANQAPVGMPIDVKPVVAFTVNANQLQTVILPTRELDCGVKPNDYASPGTCLSSNAYRITSTAPIVVYQYNVFANAYSNDASLLLPTNALGKLYRVIGWGAGHPVPILGVDRSYITVVGTKPNTEVKVRPSFKIKGHPPIAPTAAGGLITATIGPFDVLNLETDDATFQDDPKTMADLSGSVVQANQPVAVFSGVESTGAPGAAVEIPTPPGWEDMKNSCCLDHLEDQLLPMEAIGTHYVIARSPVRSTGSFREPDVIRFVGVAEPANVTTSLAPPFDQFTIAPGEVKTTWTQDNFVATADKPVMIGQILVSNGYVDGPYIGDPSLTVMPPVEQYRSEYIFMQPGGWTQSWVTIAYEVGSMISLDGSTALACVTEPAGQVNGVSYESKRCQVSPGVHRLKGDKPFGIVAYGYGSAGSYAFAGGAAVKPIYDPPPPIE